MEDKKIQLTKELVIKCYRRSFIFKRSGDIFTLILTLGISLTLLWFLHGAPINPVTICTFIISIPFTAIGIWVLSYIMYELISVISGKFYITTDKIVWRREAYETRGGSHPACFHFEKYGYFALFRAYMPLKKKSVSAYKQLNEAYIDDVYCVAVLNKSKKIIAVYNSENYYYE